MARVGTKIAAVARGRFREDLLYRFAAHHVLTSARWIDLGAFQDFGHGHLSPLIGVAMSR